MFRSQRWFHLTVLFTMLAVLALAACAGPAPAARPDVGMPALAATPMPATVVAFERAAVAPEAADFDAAAEPAAAREVPAPVTGPLGSSDRLIIKNGDFEIVVNDTAVTVDRLTALAAGAGGYLISSQLREDNGFKVATVQFAVPADQFELALSRVRELALRVLRESSSGQDVSEEFVDLQARIRNQEATAERIRSFLAQARNAEEALQVNSRLTQVEEELERLKGRANYLQQRAAFSVITVFVQTERPTPTPTPTPTPAPAWNPGQTASAASARLGVALQGLADGLIWIGVFWLPILLPFALVVLLLVAAARRLFKAAPR